MHMRLCDIFCLFQSENARSLYSKTTLLLGDERLESKRRKCYKSGSMLDFSKDHNFAMEGEALDKFKVMIEIKSTTTLLQTSKSALLPKILIADILLSDQVLASLTLGSNEPGRQGVHWRQMMDQPGDRLFLWHTVDMRI